MTKKEGQNYLVKCELTFSKIYTRVGEDLPVDNTNPCSLPSNFRDAVELEMRILAGEMCERLAKEYKQHKIIAKPGWFVSFHELPKE